MPDESYHVSQVAFEQDHLGQGWAFPVRWSRATAERRDGGTDAAEPGGIGVTMVASLEDIRQSIRIILETTLGERVMQPEFGSEVHRYVFASIHPRTEADLARDTRRALLLWERRIRDIEVRVAPNAGEVARLDVEISYFVETHRMRQSLIFPFYVNQPEGQ